MKEYIPIKEAVQKLDGFSHKTQYCINNYCLEGKIDCIKKGERWYISNDLINQAVQWRSQVVPVAELLDQYLKEHTIKDTVNFLRTIKHLIHNLYIKKEIQETLFFPGFFVKKEDVWKVEEILEKENEKRKKMEHMIPIKMAAEKMGVSEYILKGMITGGTVKAERVGGKLYLLEKEIRKFQQRQTQYIGIIDFLEDEVLKDVATVWDIEKRPNRNTLIVYLKSNPRAKELLVNWETADLHGDRRNAYYFPAYAKEVIKQELVTYLEGYGLKQKRLNMYLADEYWKSHPINKQIFKEFSEGKHVIGLAAMAEMLVEADLKEITQCADSDIRILIEYAKKQKTNVYESYAVMFIHFVRENYAHEFTINLSYDKKSRNKSINTDAYSQQEYYQIAVMTFNEQYIKNHGMIESALNNEHCAALWLYCAWLFVGAWRKSDVFGSLPVLDTPSAVEAVIDQIRGGIYGDEAVMMSAMLESEIMGRNIVPSKTRNRQKSRQLTVVIPETLREIIGTIYVINCVHHAGKKYFPMHNFKVQDFANFFGKEYTEIFGNSVISIRRANKAFLSNVAESVERNHANKAMGYAVASYARAHTDAGVEGLPLPAVTSRYLRHSLDGLTKDEVIVLLMEAGTCSFIPYMLLKTIYGGDFLKLPVSKQNLLIVDSGLDADNTEELLLAVTKNYVKAERMVEELIGAGGQQEQKKQARVILEHITNRTSIGKQKCTSCLRMAARKSCVYPKQSECVGCSYAILEKGVLFSLFDRIGNRMKSLTNARTDGEKKKDCMLLEQIEIPAVYEMLYALKEIYKVNISLYLQQLRKIINGGDTNA